MALGKTLAASFTSWKSTALGALSLFLVFADLVLKPWLAGGPFDISPFMTTDNLVIAVSLIAGVIGIVTRDANKTSEKSGVAPAQSGPQVAPETEDAIAKSFGEK